MTVLGLAMHYCMALVWFVQWVPLFAVGRVPALSMRDCCRASAGAAPAPAVWSC